MRFLVTVEKDKGNDAFHFIEHQFDTEAVFVRTKQGSDFYELILADDSQKTELTDMLDETEYIIQYEPA